MGALSKVLVLKLRLLLRLPLLLWRAKAPGGPKIGQKKSKNYEESMKSVGKMGGCCGALAYMVFAFMREVVLTIFWQGSLTLAPAKNSRIALTRSAMFMFLFIVIHAVGNLHVFLGPDDFNGYGYFYVRLYPSGFGLPANIVEEYVLLAALLHVSVALRRTWDISINYTIASGKMNLAISGILLLTFMCIHLVQFVSVPLNRSL